MGEEYDDENEKFLLDSVIAFEVEAIFRLLMVPSATDARR